MSIITRVQFFPFPNVRYVPYIWLQIHLLRHRQKHFFIIDPPLAVIFPLSVTSLVEYPSIADSVTGCGTSWVIFLHQIFPSIWDILQCGCLSVWANGGWLYILGTFYTREFYGRGAYFARALHCFLSDSIS